jgi:hypothetical protein
MPEHIREIRLLSFKWWIPETFSPEIPVSGGKFPVFKGTGNLK